MRNRVYDETLIHRRIEGRIANTALLRVCKQIHGEAEGIFNANSTFSVIVLPTVVTRNDDGATIDGEGDALYKVTGDFRLEHAGHTALDTFYDKFPEALRGRLAIHVSLPRVSANDAIKQLWPSQCFLYGLVGFLQQVSPVMKRHIHITLPEYEMLNLNMPPKDSFEKILTFSFAKLPPCFKITFGNYAIRKEFDKLRGRAVSTLRFNTVSEYVRLRKDILEITTHDYSFEQEHVINMHENVKTHAVIIEDYFKTKSRWWMLLPMEKILTCSIQIVSIWLQILKSSHLSDESLRDLGNAVVSNKKVLEEEDDLSFWRR